MQEACYKLSNLARGPKALSPDGSSDPRISLGTYLHFEFVYFSLIWFQFTYFLFLPPSFPLSLLSFFISSLTYFLSCLGCANKSTESNVWDTVAPLYSALVRVKYCALFWEHFFKEIMIKVMYSQRFSHNKDEEQVSLFTLFTWEKRSHVITLQISERILCSREIRLIFHFQEAEATGASSKEVHISSA